MIDETHPLSTLRIAVTVARRTACDPRWADGGRTEIVDPFGRLYLVRSGRGTVAHSGRVFDLRPGHLFVIPAHTPGRYRCPRRMDLLWVHFRASVFGALEPFVYFGWDTVTRIPHTLAATDMMTTVIEQHNAAGDGARLATDGAMRLLLAPFAHTQTERTNAQAREMARFAPVFAYIDRNLGRKLTLGALAGLVHLQPNYFSNLFTKVTGEPPLQFVTRRRIEAVAARLRFSDARLAALAADYGFSDAFHLSKTFKRHTGFSPRAYRRRAWREDAGDVDSA